MKKFIEILKAKFKIILVKLESSAPSSQKKNQFALYLIIILLVNIAGVTLNIRFDLTRSGTYSLSEKSKEVVSGLKENLKIKVFFSTDLPAEHQTVYRYLIDILKEYDYHGNRHFSYEIVPNDKLEKEAASYGINAVSSREFASDQVKFRKAYMGVAIQHADIMEKIEALSSPIGLEYEISSRIMKMTSKIDALLQLKKPIIITLYLDSRLKTLPIDGIFDLEKKVKEAVAESNTHNYGKLEFRLIDPSSGADPDSLVKTYGLNKLKWEGGKAMGGAAFRAGEGVFGIVLESNNKSQTIQLNVGPTLMGNYAIAGAEKLGDSINSAVGALLSVNTKIGYVTGHDEPDINDEKTREGGGILKKITSDMYEIQVIDLAKEDIPSNIGTLIINGPKSPFSDLELYRIDQYLMSGRSAVFFVDSFTEINMGQQGMMDAQPQVIPINTGLDKILTHYGVIVNKDIVLDKACAKINLGQMIKDYPLVPIIRDDTLDKKSVITKYLRGFAFFKGSSITLDEPELAKRGVLSRRLINSSNESWLMKGRINFNPFMMEAGDEKEMKSYTLAVLLTGSFESYFKGKDIPEAEGDDKGKPLTADKKNLISTEKLDLTISARKTEIIVLSSSEITKSGFIMDSQRIMSKGGQAKEDMLANAVLLHNIFDYAAGNYYSPEMRGKNLDYNPIKPYGDNARFIFKTANIAGVPLIVILCGLFIWWRRKIRRNKIQAMFSGEMKNE